MSTESTPGVLLKGEDGTHYFIPHSDLSGYVVTNVPEALQAGADVAANVPRLHAFAVQRTSDAAHMPTPEGASETAAFMPTPEGPSETAAVTPMPEGGPSSPDQA
jgi:hypothetical protein